MHSREVFTIGHSIHPTERFLRLLTTHRVEVVADVRRYPGSRRNPQFNAAALEGSLSEAGIEYLGFGEALGGRRGSARSTGAAFAAYAEHMRTDEFSTGLERLEATASERRTAVMCAEGDWRRCHRQLIADALVERGWQVLHVLPSGKADEHPARL